jgi:hypothetical protein
MYWNPSGYKAYSKDRDHQSVVHEMTWTVPGYSGRWYIYFKTQKFMSTYGLVTWWVLRPEQPAPDRASARGVDDPVPLLRDAALGAPLVPAVPGVDGVPRPAYHREHKTPPRTARS